MVQMLLQVLHSSDGPIRKKKKKVLYDKLTVSEWAAGQLSNICLIQYPILVKQTMLQAIQVLKDATSLP